MARKPMVTRTMVTTEATILALDLVNTAPFETKVVLPNTFADDKKLMAKVAEVFDNEEQKSVCLKDKKEVETLYGMTEQDFIANAKVLDPKTRKEIEVEADETETVTDEQ